MQKKANFDALTQEELARVHGTTARTLRDWDGAGHPRNLDGSYCASASIAWRLDRELHGGLNLDGERARLARAQAEKSELDLQLRKGSLLERGSVIRDGQALVIAMRARLRALPARLAPELSTQETYPAVRAMIAAGVDEALEEISDEKFASGVAAKTLDLRGDGDSTATTEVNGKPVGGRASRAVERGEQHSRQMAHRARRVSKGNPRRGK